MEKTPLEISHEESLKSETNFVQAFITCLITETCTNGLRWKKGREVTGKSVFLTDYNGKVIALIDVFNDSWDFVCLNVENPDSMEPLTVARSTMQGLMGSVKPTYTDELLEDLLDKIKASVRRDKALQVTAVLESVLRDTNAD